MNTPAEPVKTGTTTMGIKCSDGIILACDSRATGGPIVMYRDVNKVEQIAPKIACAISGAMSHCQQLAHYATYYCDVIQMNNATDKDTPVQVAAHCLQALIQNNKEQLMAQLIIGGVDEKGPHLYQVMQSGCALERSFAAGGSGSTYITSYCDSYITPGVTCAEAIPQAIKAINHATVRDGYSGGPIQIVQITNEGTKRMWVKPSQQPLNSSIVKT